VVCVSTKEANPKLRLKIVPKPEEPPKAVVAVKAAVGGFNKTAVRVCSISIVEYMQCREGTIRRDPIGGAERATCLRLTSSPVEIPVSALNYYS